MSEPEYMTPRERFRNAINFRKVDALPWGENFYDETLIKYFSQGLPAHEIAVIEWDICQNLLLNWPRFIGFDPYSYFGCINLYGCIIPVDIGPIPRFKQRKIGEDERYEKYLMNTGARSLRYKRGVHDITWYVMPSFYEFPVKDKKSWQEYKERLNPEDPKRYPKDWDKDGYLQMLDDYQEGPTMLTITGFYGFGAELMGILNFNLAFYMDPELIKSMLTHWEYFTINSIREAVETFKDRIDVVFWWEDMAEKHGPNISPKLYREFFLPHYKKVIEYLKKNKINRIMMDSDGNTQPILDCVIDAGITGHWPLEVNAGMDVRTIRKKYGNKLFLSGNIDKREVAKGGDAMRQEIDTKIPFMKETGGYIAGLDHLVPVEVSLNKFKEYADYLKKKLVY